VAITGVGGYARVMLEVLLDLQERGALRLELAVVTFPEADAEHLEFLRTASPETRVVASLEAAKMSGQKLDLMLLPVAIDAHRSLVEDSLAAGWNVLVEKPLAGCLRDAAAIVEAARGTDRFVAVGFQDMYTPCVLAMREALRTGVIGTVKEVRAFGMWARTEAYYRRNRWAGRLTVDGRTVRDAPFNNAMAHYLNLALFLAGYAIESCAEPSTVEGGLWRAHTIESCDTAILRWRTRHGPDVAVFFSHTGSAQLDPEIRVLGSSGELVWKLNQKWEIRREGETRSFPVTLLPDARTFMMEAVLRRLEYPQTAIFNAEQALPHVRAVEMAHAALPIQNFPRDRVRHVRTPENPSEEWVEVDGLEAEGLTFIGQNLSEMVGPKIL
jgi:predicted dehydrogenase